MATPQAGSSAVPILDPNMIAPDTEAAGAPAPARKVTIERGPSLTAAKTTAPVAATPTPVTAALPVETPAPAPKRGRRKVTAQSTVQTEIPLATVDTPAGLSSTADVTVPITSSAPARRTRRPRQPRQVKLANEAATTLVGRTDVELRIVHATGVTRINFSRADSVEGDGQAALAGLVQRVDTWLDQFRKDLGVELPAT